jgi:hypothetical protein
MRTFMIAAAGLLMASGVAVAQTPATTPGQSQGYSTNGPYTSSNGAAVAPNGGLQSGTGTTLVNPQTQSGRSAPIGSNSGSGNGGGTSGGNASK